MASPITVAGLPLHNSLINALNATKKLQLRASKERLRTATTIYFIRTFAMGVFPISKHCNDITFEKGSLFKLSILLPICS